MDGTWPHDHVVRQELEKILASAGFCRNERLSRFLRFIVDCWVEGRHNELKESLIGVKVFDRSPGYDPQRDAIVRTEAGRLRARLSRYYDGPGSRDTLVIDVPKGGYTPRFRHRDAVVAEMSEAQATRSSRATIAIFAIVTVLAASASGWWLLYGHASPIVIAVLPLENLNHDPASDYLADGLSDELIRNLSIIDGLAVRSRTSSFALKGKSLSVQEVGERLSADYVLEGSVFRADQNLRINVQLVQVRDDSPVWSAKFDREVTNVAAVQDEISRGIVNSLRLKFGRGRRRYETNAEAYDLYLRARAIEFHGGMPSNRLSVPAYAEVVAKDSTFAPAYAGLAEAYAARSGWFGSDPAEEAANMRAAAEKAIRLDPLLPEAFDAMGMAYARAAQWDRAESSFRRAIELAPSRSDTYRHFATFFYWPLARMEEALEQLRRAEQNDPLSPEVEFNLAYVLASLRRDDVAARYCEKLPADFWAKTECLGRVRLEQGKVGEAIEVLAPAFQRGVPAGSEIRGFLGYAYARTGRRQEAEQLAASSPQNPFNQAEIFAGLGDEDRTFAALDRAAMVGPVRTGWALMYPGLAPLRNEQRVKALRKRIGLPE